MMQNQEILLRRRLGIPPAAEKVIIFSESSHWDPDWLFTSAEYYRLRIRPLLERVLHELEKDPRRVFSLEGVFFLKRFWEKNPSKQETLRRLLNLGRLRLSGSGFTTPDTLLPQTEAILRDYLLGQQWLRENGITQIPRLAYLPDNFGLSPALPAILSALGFQYTAFARIDGGWFPGADYENRRNFPRPGSCAHLLLRDLKTTDFIWRAPDGAEVLARFLPFTYGQGDQMAVVGPGRWMGLTLGLSCRSEKHVAQRIQSYVRHLAPFARTPYLLCPIGFDFVDPIPDLLALLDRYNRSAGESAGIFALNAAMEDYFELVALHRERLPILELDPNPYWMGFYSARPEMKQRCQKLCRDLLAAETLCLLAEQKNPAAADLFPELKTAWHILAVSNHHDFITGTSPRRVWEKEQKPWLIKAQTAAEGILKKAREFLLPSASPPAPGISAPRNETAKAPKSVPLQWSLENGRLLVETAHYLLELEEREGGCLTRWYDPTAGDNLLGGPGNDLVLYEDSGGLWRMGHEFRGGVFRELDRASRHRPAIRAEKKGEILTAEIESRLGSRRILRRMWFRPDSPLLRMQIQGSAAKRRTISCRFPLSLRPAGIVMDVPGGVVSRPLIKIFNPTFWPALHFAHVVDTRSGRGQAVFLGGPASISADPQGGMEWVVLRNTPRERAFGFLPLLGHPAFGPDPDEHSLEYAILTTARGNWRENRLPLLAETALASGEKDASPLPWAGVIQVSDEEVQVTALKKAEDGGGVIVRLFSARPSRSVVKLRWLGRPIRSAFLTDAREEILEPLPVHDGEASVLLHRSIVTIKLELEGNDGAVKSSV